MQLAQILAGFSETQADNLRRAMGKKKKEILDSEYIPFSQGMERNGYSAGATKAIWDVLLPFAEYSFNRSHSIGYSYLTYRGSWLKANHPREYMTSLLSSSKDSDESARYIAETRRMKIPVLGPDIQESGPGFTLTKEGTIRYGLTAIRGVGAAAAKALVEGRPYRNIDQFFRKAPPKVLNAGVLSALVKSGAFDSVWSSRTELLEQGPELGQVALTHRRERKRGQRTILNTRYRPSKAQGQTEEDRGVRRALEQEVLGTVLTWPKAVLHLSRPLQPIEWKHVKEALGYQPPSQEVEVQLGKTRWKLNAMTTVNQNLTNAMRAVGIGVIEE